MLGTSADEAQNFDSIAVLQRTLGKRGSIKNLKIQFNGYTFRFDVQFTQQVCNGAIHAPRSRFTIHVDLHGVGHPQSYGSRIRLVNKASPCEWPLFRHTIRGSGLGMHATNQQLAALLRSMAELLSAARELIRIGCVHIGAPPTRFLPLEEDITVVGQRHGLEDIEGIGKDLAVKIQEFLETGTIRTYEELKTPLPCEIKSWVSLPGLSDRS